MWETPGIALRMCKIALLPPPTTEIDDIMVVNAQFKYTSLYIQSAKLHCGRPSLKYKIERYCRHFGQFQSHHAKLSQCTTAK